MNDSWCIGLLILNLCDKEFWKFEFWIRNFNLILGIKLLYFFIKDIIIVFLGGYVIIWFKVSNFGLWFLYS